MYYCASIGLGETSLVNMIVKGTSTAHPPQTIGYTVDVKRDKYKFEEMGHRYCSNWDNSAPLANGGPGRLPVPFLVIGNKADVAEKGARGSSGNLVDMACQ
ncbi:hypothetical protein Ccrd_008076 [Cynara cardunculus var. scolymus]|uniref:Small GTPase superfamily n=1 Tax=Cynara cardunculus var. scolymus TaxID=59895 RepID=A0A118JSX3_CYNCS|nr:hypothetical protein Ccrd_008076 [Cynara cardunculus var. scolymus]